MKSSLFTKGVQWPHEEYRKRFDSFLKLSPDNVKTLASQMSSLLAADTPQDTHESMARLIDLLRDPPETVDRAILWAIDTVARLAKHSADSIDDVMEDFEEVGLLPSNEAADTLRLFLSEALEAIENEIRPKKLRLATVRRGAPILTGIEFATDLRAVIDPPYELGMSLDEYSPSCREFVPVYLLTIYTDGGPIDALTVQLDSTDLKRLQSTLRAAQIEGRIAEAALSGEEVEA